MENRNTKWNGFIRAGRAVVALIAACILFGPAFGQPDLPKESIEPGELTRVGGQTGLDENLILTDSNLQNIDAVKLIFPVDSSSFANGVYPLDAENCMQLPAYGLMCLEGKSVSDIKKALESTYSEYLRYPFVKIEFLMRIGLLGGFYRPGLYYVHSTTPLWDVIALGGGPEREDGFQKMKWIRNEEILQRNLTNDIVSGKTLNELNFRSGDVIAVLDQPKLGVWATLRTEVFPFLLMLASMATAYVAVYSIVEQ